MRRTRAMLQAVLAAAVALAGCAEGPDTATNAVDEPVFDAATGALRVTLRDDEFRPVGNGTVGILAADASQPMTAAADPAGRATFSSLTPGTYAVEAVAVGFEATHVEAQVEAGRLVELDVELVPLPYDGPYYETFPASGLVRSVLWRVGPSCQTVVQPPLGTCLGFQADDVTVYHKLGPEWATVLDETYWMPNTAGFHQRAYVFATFPNVTDFSGVPDFASPGHFEASGTTPVILRIERQTLYDRGFAEENHFAGNRGTRFRHVNDFDDVNASGVASVGIMIDQQMDAFISVFYQEPAPAGFTALPDE